MGLLLLIGIACLQYHHMHAKTMLGLIDRSAMVVGS
jgi:hypothetical protein